MNRHISNDPLQDLMHFICNYTSFIMQAPMVMRVLMTTNCGSFSCPRETTSCSSGNSAVRAPKPTTVGNDRHDLKKHTKLRQYIGSTSRTV